MKLRMILTLLFLAACGSNHQNNVSDLKDVKDSGQEQEDASVSNEDDAATPEINDAGTPDEPKDSGADVQDSGKNPDSPKDSGTPDASKPEPKPVPPVVIVDPTRPVTEMEESDFTVLSEERNACTAKIGAYLVQYAAVESESGVTEPTCGALPDEVGNMSKLDANRLSIPKNCTLGHYYNQNDMCTLTTELICELENGCTENRYTDFNWQPATEADTTWFGDGLMRLTRTCPVAADSCSGTYHAAAFPKPQ